MSDDRFIRFYDSLGMELLGPDGNKAIPENVTNSEALKHAYEETQTKAKSYREQPDKHEKPRQCYAAVLSDSVMFVGVPVTLENPLYPDTF